MPRRYVRKTTRQNWNEISMANALKAVEDGMPYKTASKQFSVPLMALKRRAKGKNVHALGAVKVLGSKKKVFNEKQELELVQYIKDNEETMYGLTTEDVLKFAYKVAERNKIKHPFSNTKCKAGKDWLRGFRLRHPDITLRAPESTSAARARAFNKPIVDKFYGILKNTQEKQSFPPHRIFNVDETSLNTVPTKNTKIFAKKGRKQVARIISAERGESTTGVICGSAGGNFIPPMLIFRRLRMNNNPGRVVSVFQISKIFGEAYLKAAVPLNIIKGFEKCGISPFNPDVFTDVDFAAASTTDQEENNESHEPHPVTSAAASDTIQVSGEGLDSNLSSATPIDLLNSVEELSAHGNVSPSILFNDIDAIETISPPACEEAVTPPPHVIPLPEVPEARPSSDTPVPRSYDDNSSTDIDENYRSASPTASTSFAVPLRQIQPLPKMEERRAKTNKARGTTAILTSTPYKNFLEEERDKKAEKELKKIERMNKKKITTASSQKTKGKFSSKDKPRGKKNLAKKRKKTGKGPKPKIRKHDMSESSSDDDNDDTECMFCTERYSKDNTGEGWIRCCVCLRWGHEACAGVDPGDADEFTCDFCADDCFSSVRKQLSL